MRHHKWLLALIALPLAAIAALLIAWQLRSRPQPPPPAPPRELAAYKRFLPLVMSTVADLTVVARKDQSGLANQTLDEIVSALNDIESRMSSHLDGSEISNLNSAPVGQPVPLSPQTLEVLRHARAFTPITQGAFDVTCRPILETWKAAGVRNEIPTDAELARAVSNTGWKWFSLADTGAVRLNADASIDLGGIAKKYAIDRAVQIMMHRGVAGGMVNIGGDVRCFGERVGGGPWRIAVRRPFSADRGDSMATIAVPAGAVCTSGNYERFVEIHGLRYSHIVDPRTGRPCNDAASVTVVGPDAATAGLWATSLSVLGLQGLKLVPADSGIEVMMVVGDNELTSRWYRTPGFDRLLLSRPEDPATDLPPGLWNAPPSK